jgi:hypothetical protein
MKKLGSRDSSVGIAVRYGLDGPGIESRWGRDFPRPSRPALGPTQPPIKWVPGLFPGVKRPGRSVDHPRLSNAEVKERVELYFYSPSGPSWPVLGWTLTKQAKTLIINISALLGKLVVAKPIKKISSDIRNPKFR